ncbi:MAG TPA: carbohydrate kinase family protein, partial [Candidatus Nanopelagicales bacterium]|nr:carbohydrate kinase family protein [Candidatus Nanopelagicales bacterium]
GRILGEMATLPRHPHPRRLGAVVLGDLAVDVVLAPARPLEHGTDVPGVVRLHQGGSAANTARWLARLGVPSTLVCAVGRDGFGRALVAALERQGVTVRAAHPAGARTARIGMVVDEAGERSFVADRGAADLLAPDDLRPAWFRGAGVLHLPGYSLLGSPLREAAAQAIAIAREAGALLAVDLASAAPLLAHGRPAAHVLVRGVAADLLFANAAEASAFLGNADLEQLLDFAPIAVVKRAAGGATLVARSSAGPATRLEVATRAVTATDTTGAGDAFDAGFLAAWLAAGRSAAPGDLRRAVVAGHRAAARQIKALRPELALG